jgi:hypothetical protein
MLINTAKLLIMDGLTMKLFLLFFALLSTSHVFASPACDRNGILDNLIDYEKMIMLLTEHHVDARMSKINM